MPQKWKHASAAAADARAQRLRTAAEILLAYHAGRFLTVTEKEAWLRGFDVLGPTARVFSATDGTEAVVDEAANMIDFVDTESNAWRLDPWTGSLCHA